MKRKNIVTALCIALTLSVGAEPKAADTFFNHKAVPLRNKAAVSKWTGVLARWGHEKSLPGSGCSPTKWDGCGLTGWRGLVDDTPDPSNRSSLQKFNRALNWRLYIEDIVNWGRGDYWAAPGQFFAHDGDCEDFAISKYFGLRRKGKRPEDLRVIVVRDRGLRIYHAVLLFRDNGEWLMLDNRTDAVIDAIAVRHYIPVYAVSEAGSWVFVR